MWDRKELKAKGKAAMKANYWRSVVAALLLMIAITALAGGSGSSANNSLSDAKEEAEVSSGLMEMMEQDPEAAAAVVIIVVTTIAVIVLVLTILDVFVLNPLEVGGRRFFLVNSEHPAEVGEVAYAFKNHYLNMVKTAFLRDLYLGLWALLLVVPALVKAYSYRMTPYIMAEHPEMKANEAITLSRKMMDGHKLNAFLLDLSFIGWNLLSVITAGIAGVFYVNPYQYATDAELYKAIRNV